MCVVSVLGREGLAEVRVQKLGVVVAVEASSEAVDVVLVDEDPSLKEESQDLGRGHPAQVLVVQHLEAIHQIEVSLLRKPLFGLLELLFVQDHFVEDLDKLALVVRAEWPHRHLGSALNDDGAGVDASHLSHRWALWVGIDVRAVSSWTIVHEITLDPGAGRLALLVHGLLESILSQWCRLRCQSVAIGSGESALALCVWPHIEVRPVDQAGSLQSGRKLASLQAFVLIV